MVKKGPENHKIFVCVFFSFIFWKHRRLPFHCYVYFWGISHSRRNPRVICWGSSPNLICSHVPMFPWKYFFSVKWERSKEIKRELFAQREVPVLMHSPEVWEQAPREWSSSTLAFSWGEGHPKGVKQIRPSYENSLKKNTDFDSYCGWCWCWLGYDFNAEEPLARTER
jgi:hypothetical protein